ncbi:MAG: hypothetical protein IJF83_06140 [Methanobrevibacter sp.]|nr:hypothetical protein [Methanobrevibacter sp.]
MYNLTYETSKECVISNDNSLKITFNDGWSFINIGYVENLENETYTGVLKVYNNSNHNITVRIINMPTYKTDVIVPPINQIQAIRLSLTNTTTANGVKFQINSYENSTIYIDEVFFNKR